MPNVATPITGQRHSIVPSLPENGVRRWNPRISPTPLEGWPPSKIQQERHSTFRTGRQIPLPSRPNSFIPPCQPHLIAAVRRYLLHLASNIQPLLIPRITNTTLIWTPCRERSSRRVVPDRRSHDILAAGTHQLSRSAQVFTGPRQQSSGQGRPSGSPSSKRSTLAPPSFLFPLFLFHRRCCCHKLPSIFIESVTFTTGHHTRTPAAQPRVKPNPRPQQHPSQGIDPPGGAEVTHRKGSDPRRLPAPIPPLLRDPIGCGARLFQLRFLLLQRLPTRQAGNHEIVPRR